MKDFVAELDLCDVSGGGRAVAGLRPRTRMHCLLGVYAGLLMIVLARAAYLEIEGGQDFRAIARAPVVETEIVEPERGRITDRFGETLALDYQLRALAVHYRYLQSPPDAQWLRREARKRVPPAKRRSEAALVAAEQQLRNEIALLQRQLAEASGIHVDAWNRRTSRIQQRVERLAEAVNRRRKSRFTERTSTVPDDEVFTLQTVLTGLFSPPAVLPPADIAVAEQVSYHRVVDQIPRDLARRIESAPSAFPGVRVVSYTRRHYPQNSLAANLVGHIGMPSAAQATRVPLHSDGPLPRSVGLMGIEEQFDKRLAGSPGAIQRVSSRQGELIEVIDQRRARIGGDVVLSIDAQLQGRCEQLLERFDWRTEDQDAVLFGGALLVMDIHNGEMLAAACQPRFDPNWFATGDPRLETVLSDPRQPLFDRALRMELPPGSVFKPLVAVALLEHGIVRAETRFRCQGYFRDPDRLRCQIFREHGIGHGEVDLLGALAQSCNVYFFHHVIELGSEPLVAWTRRFGFGTRGGNVPLASELSSQDALQALAIGQHTLTVTPLQVLRMYAAIANGGCLVEPVFVRAHLATETGEISAMSAPDEGSRIRGLDADTLATIRQGLERVVADPLGTAYHTARSPGVSVAGKTGTAQAGADQLDHAWFAGYVPADEPRYAFVIALEHGGSGSNAAGTIARHLIEQLQQLGYLRRDATANRAFPPGKG